MLGEPAVIAGMTRNLELGRCFLLKNIIIAGPSRAGKSTLARKIKDELNYFVISLDKLVATFGEAYPQDTNVSQR